MGFIVRTHQLDLPPQAGRGLIQRKRESQSSFYYPFEAGGNRAKRAAGNQRRQSSRSNERDRFSKQLKTKPVRRSLIACNLSETETEEKFRDGATCILAGGSKYAASQGGLTKVFYGLRSYLA